MRAECTAQLSAPDLVVNEPAEQPGLDLWEPIARSKCPVSLAEPNFRLDVW